MDIQHAKLIAAMTDYDKGDAMRIQHFMKVHDYAVTIATLEGVGENLMSILESAAILHDIGIHATLINKNNDMSLENFNLIF